MKRVERLSLRDDEVSPETRTYVVVVGIGPADRQVEIVGGMISRTNFIPAFKCRTIATRIITRINEV